MVFSRMCSALLEYSVGSGEITNENLAKELAVLSGLVNIPANPWSGSQKLMIDTPCGAVRGFLE